MKNDLRPARVAEASPLYTHLRMGLQYKNAGPVYRDKAANHKQKFFQAFNQAIGISRSENGGPKN